MPHRIPENWDLELKVFSAANDRDLPSHVRDIIRELWANYCNLEEQLEATRVRGTES